MNSQSNHRKMQNGSNTLMSYKYLSSSICCSQHSNEVNVFYFIIKITPSLMHDDNAVIMMHIVNKKKIIMVKT